MSDNGKKRRNLVFFLFFIGIFIFSGICYADSIDNKGLFDEISKFEKVTENEGKDSVVKYVLKYDLDYFRPYYGSSSMLGQVVDFVVSKTGLDFFKTLTNFFFVANKVIYQSVDYVIDKVYSGQVFNDWLTTFFDFSHNLYNQLFGYIGVGVVVLWILYITIKYAMGKRHEAKGLIIRFCLIIGFSTVWFGYNPANFSSNNSESGIHVETIESKGEAWAKKLNELSLGVEGLIFQATGNVKNLELAKNEDEAVLQVRQLYFKKAVLEPYLLMNYGTLDMEALDKAGINIKEFIREEGFLEGGSEVKKAVDEASGDKENKEIRSYLMGVKSGYKLIVSIASSFINLSVGIPILVIGCTHLIFEVMALVMLFFISIGLILAFFPTLDHYLIYSIKKFLGFIFLKSAHGVLLLIMFLVFNMIDQFIPPASIVTFIVNGLVKFIVMIVLYKKRKMIMGKIGLGGIYKTTAQAKHYTNEVKKAPREMVNRANEMKNTGQEAILKGAEVAGNFYRPLKYAVDSAKVVRTVQEERREKRSKEGQVINPLELEGRTPQQIPYSGKKVVYGTMDEEQGEQSKGSPMQRTPQSVTPVANQVVSKDVGNIASQPISQFISGKLPIDSLIPAISGQSVRKNLSIAKPSGKYIGQSIPLTSQNNVVPKLVANNQLSQQVLQLKQQRLQSVQGLGRMASVPDQLLGKINRPIESGSVDGMSKNINHLKSVTNQMNSSTSIQNNQSNILTNRNQSNTVLNQTNTQNHLMKNNQSNIVTNQNHEKTIIEGEFGKDFQLPKGRTPQKPK